MTTNTALSLSLSLYTDGAASPNPGPCSCGAVIVDSQNQVIWTHSEFLGPGTNNVGEITAIYRGILRVCELCPTEGVTALTVYSDSELCVSILNGTKHVKKQHLMEMVLRIRQAIKPSMRVRFEWIKAHNNHIYNEMADTLAGRALELPMVIPKSATSVSVSDPTSRLILRCTYAEKESVKRLGARWDATKKIWYTEDNEANREKFAQWVVNSS